MLQIGRLFFVLLAMLMLGLIIWTIIEIVNNGSNEGYIKDIIFYAFNFFSSLFMIAVSSACIASKKHLQSSSN